MPANHRHFLNLPNNMKLEIRGLQARNAELAGQIYTTVVIKGQEPYTVYAITPTAAHDVLNAALTTK